MCKGSNEEPGNYRHVSLTLVLGNLMENLSTYHMAWTGEPGDQGQPASMGLSKA